jgi:hypothetical protein
MKDINVMITFSHNIIDTPRYTIKVNLTCCQAVGAFSVAMEALVLIYFDIMQQILTNLEYHV